MKKYLALLLLVAACSPTVKVEGPDKPIEINMNIKIEQNVKVQIEREAQQAVKKNKDIF